MQIIRSFRVWLPTAILIVVALAQKYCVYAYQLEPWFGGGFDMFARLDSQNFRAIHMRCTANDGTSFACTHNYMPALVYEMYRTKLFPTTTNLRHLGEHCLNESTAIKGITMQVNTIALDLSGPSISRKVIKEVEVVR